MSRPRPLDIPAVASRLGSPVEGGEVYRLFERLGFVYGPRYRVIRSVASDGEEVLADLASDGGSDVAPRHWVAPALLDGAIQSAIGLSFGPRGLPEGTVIPASVGRVRFFRPVGASALVHIRRRGREGDPSDVIRLAVRLCDKSGRVAVEIDDLIVLVRERISTSPRQTQAGPTVVSPVSGVHLCEEVWTEIEPTTQPGNRPHGPILVLDQGVERWQALGESAVLAMPGSGFAQLADRLFIVDPQSGEASEQLWRALRDVGRWPRAVLDLRPAADSSAPSDGFLRQMALLQGALVAGAETPTDILRVVRGDGRGVPAEAMLAGLARSLALEAPALALRVLELPVETTDKALLDAAAVELADMAAQRRDGDARPPAHVRRTADGRRLGPAFRLDPGGGEGATLRRGGTYIVTGGLGGIGRQVALHLAKQWQAKLLLLGRSPLSGEGESFLAALRAAGGEALYLPVDVADRAALAQALAEARERLGPFHGVIHAAGATRDGFLRQKSLADAREVLRPKVEGTINLDAETSEDPLDFFVAFSSLAASFGNVGQADYAAANRFMETFGDSRKGPGRTLAIGWTFWKDGGLAARDADDRALQEATGLRWIDAEEGVAAFERALATPGRVLLVIAGEKDRIGRFLDARPVGPAPSEPQEVAAPETAVGPETGRWGMHTRRRLPTGKASCRDRRACRSGGSTRSGRSSITASIRCWSAGSMPTSSVTSDGFRRRFSTSTRRWARWPTILPPATLPACSS